MLDKNTSEKAKEVLGDLRETVRLITFTQEIECAYCVENRELAKAVAGLSEKIAYESFDLLKDEKASEQYGIDKIPALAVVSENKDYGIRFFGIPSGYEFISLLEAVKTVSTGAHGLSEDTLKKIETLRNPVHIQVYVTPTCPYCPRAVVLAHKLAYVSEKIKSDMVEAIEFPHLAYKYSVMGVPKSVINETVFIEGAVPERSFVDRVMQAAGR